MSVVLIKALQLLCCLSLLVALHELGHFLFSKLFKVRVEKFYLFFNPKFHLFSTRDKWFAKRFPKIAANETEYGIGWLPLGGYVKIAGMIDESMDREQLKKPAQADEFRSQAVWKRFFIMVGGVLMNVLTSLVIYSAIMFTWGRDVMPIERLKDGFVFNQTAQEMGFQNGDLLVKIGGDSVKRWAGMMPPYMDGDVLRALSEEETATVRRAGREVTIQLPATRPNMLEMAEMTPPFIAPFVLPEIDSVMSKSAAEQAQLRKGHRILAVDGAPIRTWTDFDSLMLRKSDRLASVHTQADSMALRQMQLIVTEAGRTTADTIQLTLDESYRMGIVKSSLLSYVEPQHLDYTLLSSIPAGCQYGWNAMSSYVHDLQYVFTPQGAKSVGSFITIGSIFPETWDWMRFWNLTALISIILAVMNILPIPGLDGGHVLFLLIEGITGRPLSEKMQVVFEYIGMGLLILLMVWAFGNDLLKFVF